MENQFLSAKLKASLGKFLSRFITGVVRIVSDVNLFNAVFFEGFPMIGCEAVHTIGSGDVAETRAPES